MAPPDELVDAYHGRLEILRDNTAGGLVSAWDELDSWRDEDAERFVARTAPLLEGAKVATVATSAAFYALTLGLAPAAVAASAVLFVPRITDPFLATWHALAVGRSLTEAVTAGRSQAEATGFDFVQSVARRTGDHVASTSGRSHHWARVPGPKACDWCRTVAGQTYRTAESADFGHSRCDCVAVPA